MAGLVIPNVDFAFVSLYGIKNFTFSTGLNLFLRLGFSSIDVHQEDIVDMFGDTWSMIGGGVRYPISDSISFELGLSRYEADPSEVYNRSYLGLTFIF